MFYINHLSLWGGYCNFLFIRVPLHWCEGLILYRPQSDAHCLTDSTFHSCQQMEEEQKENLSWENGQKFIELNTSYFPFPTCIECLCVCPCSPHHSLSHWPSPWPPVVHETATITGADQIPSESVWASGSTAALKLKCRLTSQTEGEKTFWRPVCICTPVHMYYKSFCKTMSSYVIMYNHNHNSNSVSQLTWNRLLCKCRICAALMSEVGSNTLRLLHYITYIIRVV